MFALEADNYIVWNKELKDASPAINTYLQEEIERVLENKKLTSCSEIRNKIGEVFKSRLVHDNPVENWLMRELGEGEIFPESIHYVAESIYRDPYRFYIPYFGLAPNIQVNGYYFGTDKLSHFASTGMIYFKEYERALLRGKNRFDAMKAAIDWGIKDENELHGYWASGVFSFADLEANYQGLLFYQNLCTRYLKYVQGRWVLQQSPDIADYVNGNWDETYLLPYRLPGNWNKVKKVLKEKYCPRRNDPEVLARHQYYARTSPASFSMDYLKGIQLLGTSKVPQAQTLEEACRP